LLSVSLAGGHIFNALSLRLTSGATEKPKGSSSFAGTLPAGFLVGVASLRGLLRVVFATAGAAAAGDMDTS
jgi:hypothetical protein